MAISGPIASALSTVNASLKQSSDHLLNSVIKNVDPTYYIPAWCTNLPFMQAKAKSTIINKFNGK